MAKRKRHNPEHKAFKGKSHRESGLSSTKRVKDIRNCPNLICGKCESCAKMSGELD